MPSLLQCETLKYSHMLSRAGTVHLSIVMQCHRAAGAAPDQPRDTCAGLAPETGFHPPGCMWRCQDAHYEHLPHTQMGPSNPLPGQGILKFCSTTNVLAKHVFQVPENLILQGLTADAGGRPPDVSSAEQRLRILSADASSMLCDDDARSHRCRSSQYRYEGK